MDGHHYVYVLESLSDPSRHYTGLTEDIKKRLQKRNQGGVPHTAKFVPCKFEWPSRSDCVNKLPISSLT